MSIDKDEVIVHYLSHALSNLENAEVVMHGGVGDEVWPKVGRLLSSISHTMKQIELTVSGFG